MKRLSTAVGLSLLCAGVWLQRSAALHASDVDRAAEQFAGVVAAAENSLSHKAYGDARVEIERALELDPKSPKAWELRARWAEAVAEKDEIVYSLHKQVRLSIAQKRPRSEIDALRKRLEALDPIATDLLKMRDSFIKKLIPLADRYEKEGRPHSTIRVHQQILALDPERVESELAIQRISALPDPSLAETAKPKDLLADVSEEWIRDHDAKHKTWKTRAKLERENYVTYTDAGYEVLARSAEAMEQMNAFYRLFFKYGSPDNPRSVPRIELHIFRTRDEYLKLGAGPPLDWSGGQFTGSAVETYIDTGGFEQMTGTLFHEAAHQFVSLATSAAGWLNEGLASFFEGCRILANGTVIMNLPANHRLFPLVDRMSKGWMADASDGIDPQAPSKSEPEKSPTFRIVLENKYQWGPPWYAPTWGVVYFLYNYQDPGDGRFVYRSAFREFVNSSGGRVGEGAVENFEKIVLGNPQRPTPGVDLSSSPDRLKLPRTVEQLDEVWKEWLTSLRDEQAGQLEVSRPYLTWARHAITRKDYDDASEHFEKGLVAASSDPDLLSEYAEHLAARCHNTDRATKLLLQALQVVESAEKIDEARIRDLEQRLAKWDPKRETLERIHEDLGVAAKAIVERYLAANLPLMTMEVSSRLGTELRIPGMFTYYEEAARKSGKSLGIWKLAYNARDLGGWSAGGDETFSPYGNILRSRFGEYVDGKYDYRFLTLDTVTSGDFSMQAEVQAERGKNAFCGLVFGRKGATAFHALIFFPGGSTVPAESVQGLTGFVDLTSFYGSGSFQVWRHNPIDLSKKGWHTFRLDVSGRLVDVWFDGELIVTQEFPSLDVLRGSFGLITGPGESQFRNVRYLAREARDPAAAIERKIRMEKIKSSGSADSGTFVDRVPPFPAVSTWMQGPRRTWDEKGAVPTLLVLWSVKQNEAIPLHDWLADVARRTANVGLEIVCISEPDDPARIAEYLKAHPFPGSVGIDSVIPSTSRFGETLDAYFIGRFNLPRLLLLDVDHRVFWEGDPGFAVGEKWTPRVQSYLDAPLEQLKGKRKLLKLLKWRKAWVDSSAALHDGDVEAVAPLLLEARGLPGDGVPEVEHARGSLAAIERALGSIESTVQSIAGMEAEPALQPLVAWASFLGKPLDPRQAQLVRAALSKPNAKAWEHAVASAKKARSQLKPGQELAAMRDLLKAIEPLQGPIPKSFAADIKAVIAGGDGAAAAPLLAGAERRPSLWLAREYFKL